MFPCMGMVLPAVFQSRIVCCRLLIGGESFGRNSRWLWRWTLIEFFFGRGGAAAAAAAEMERRRRRRRTASDFCCLMSEIQQLIVCGWWGDRGYNKINLLLVFAIFFFTYCWPCLFLLWNSSRFPFGDCFKKTFFFFVVVAFEKHKTDSFIHQIGFRTRVDRRRRQHGDDKNSWKSTKQFTKTIKIKQQRRRWWRTSKSKNSSR